MTSQTAPATSNNDINGRAPLFDNVFAVLLTSATYMV